MGTSFWRADRQKVNWTLPSSGDEVYVKVPTVRDFLDYGWTRTGVTVPMIEQEWGYRRGSVRFELVDGEVKATKEVEFGANAPTEPGKKQGSDEEETRSVGENYYEVV